MQLVQENGTFQESL